MKNLLSSIWLLSLSLLVLCLAFGWLTRSSITPEVFVNGELLQSSSPQGTVADAELVVDGPADEEPVLNPPFTLVSSELVVPTTVNISPATSEIIKLANAGLDENVMLAFVTNSAGDFSLGSDEIVYLTDIGVSPAVIKAMLLRDHDLPESPVANFAQQPGTLATVNPDSVSVAAPESVLPPDTAVSLPTSDTATPPQTASLDDADFYGALSPYGNWVDVSGYGRCWQPTVAVLHPDWQPYFDNGRWVDTDCGWYWSSGYSWGWAPFHYGRWFHHATLNWCWAPERVWAPSWVCWRNGSSYFGWAPLPPAAHFSASTGLTFQGHRAETNFHFALPANSFRFVPTNHLTDAHLSGVALPRPHVHQLFSHTAAFTDIRVHDHTVVNEGPLPNAGHHGARASTSTIALQPLTANSPYGQRERFESNGAALAVFRPGSGAQTRHPGLNRSSSAQPASSPNNSLVVIGHKEDAVPERAPYVYFASAPASQTADGEAPAIPPLRQQPASTVSAPVTETQMTPSAPPTRASLPWWMQPRQPNSQQVPQQSRNPVDDDPRAAAEPVNPTSTHAVEKPRHEHIRSSSNQDPRPVAHAPHSAPQTEPRPEARSVPPVSAPAPQAPREHSAPAASRPSSSSSSDRSSSSRR